MEVIYFHGISFQLPSMDRESSHFKRKLSKREIKEKKKKEKKERLKVIIFHVFKGLEGLQHSFSTDRHLDLICLLDLIWYYVIKTVVQ